MKKINKLGTIIVTSVLASMLTVNTASADQTATVDSESIVFGDIRENAKVRSINATGVMVNGKPVVRYVRNPATHWNPKKALKVPFAKNYYAGVRSGKPFRLHKDQEFPDTYIGMAADMTEQDVAVTNKVKTTWNLFDVVNGQFRNRGFWTGKKWINDCVNPKPSTTPTIDISQVHVVKQRGSLSVKIMGSLALWATTSGRVTVDCGSSSAEAWYSAKAEAEIEGFVFVKASTRQEAIIKGAAELKAKYRMSQEATLALRGDAEIKLAGSATATCKSDEDNPGSIVEVTDVNDVLYGNTRTIRVRGVVPTGQTATLRVSAGIGTIADSDKTISLGAGEFVRDITYTAPTEGTSDTVTFDLYGSDNVLDDTASDTFELRSNPVDPNKVILARSMQ